MAAGWPPTSRAVAPARRASGTRGGGARAGTARLEYLRGEIGRARGNLDPGDDRVAVLRERAVERCAAGAAVARVVGEEGDLELLGDHVLGEPERHAVVRRRDPEDVGARRRIDEVLVAVVDDADRDVLLRGDLPAGVDAGAVGDDRYRVAVDGAADVGDGAARGP